MFIMVNHTTVFEALFTCRFQSTKNNASKNIFIFHNLASRLGYMKKSKKSDRGKLL